MSGFGEPEWEQWPGRGHDHERPRRGLRALFTPSDGFDQVEELIDARGRELEKRVAALRTALADLDLREERVTQLQRAVENLLRDGSAELDQRHAALALEVQTLQKREDAVAQAEAALEARRSELGAVELRRAATERREEALERRHAELEEQAAEIRTRSEQLADREADVGLSGSRRTWRKDAHLRVIPGGSYRLVEQAGPPPDNGVVVTHDEVAYRVARLGPSPLPRDDRRCAFLEPA